MFSVWEAGYAEPAKRFMPLNQFALKHRSAIVVPLDKSQQRDLMAVQRMQTRSGIPLNRDVLTVQRNLAAAIPYRKRATPPQAQALIDQMNASSKEEAVLGIYGDAAVTKSHPFSR